MRWFGTSRGQFCKTNLRVGGPCEVETIRLRVQGMHRQYIRALPLHHTQREVETGEWYSIFEYRMKPTFDLRQELLSRGDAVEVLSPRSLRDEMQSEIKRLQSLYGL